VLPSSTPYKQVIHGPVRQDSRVDVEDIFGNVLASDVPINGGSVRANLARRVTRNATFTVSDEWFPRTPTDPFSPFQAVVKIRSGIRYGDGSRELFPLFTGRVTTANRAADGQVTFQADDLAADVVLFRFEQPRSTSTALILTEIERLITDVLPAATFGPHGVVDAPTPRLTWDEDRGKALDDLSEALGGRWYALGDGTFVVRSFEYLTGPVLQTFADGPGGLMSEASMSITRNGTANSVIVVSERLDGTDPVRVIARDTGTVSPTQFGGKFGKVTQIVKVQTPLTTIEAQTLARTQLTAAVALTEQWSADVVPDMTTEPGDTVLLSYRGISSVQIIDTISYPLSPTSAMSLGTRGTVTLEETT